MGPAARAASLQATRAEAAAHDLARARAALDLPTTVLPLLASASWGAAEVTRLADALASPGPGEPAWLASGGRP